MARPPARPLASVDFFDNRDKRRTLKAALRRTLSLASHKAPQKHKSRLELMIATSFFTAKGWFQVSRDIERIPKVRLLVGVERPPFDSEFSPHSLEAPPRPIEQSRFKHEITQVLAAHYKALVKEYSLSEFDEETDKLWQTLPETLRSPRFQVRRYQRSFFHAKAWVLKGFEDQEGDCITAGSSNLTRAGLEHNQEINFRLSQPELLQACQEWYEQVWQEAEPFDLAALYEQLLEPVPPYLIYLRALYECYKDDIPTPLEDSDESWLTSFQKHGVWRARRILDEYNGVLVADSVGLGKTFLAGELIREYLNRRLQVLVILPASLELNWKKFLKQHDLGDANTISYQNFATATQQPDDTRHLSHSLDKYQLIVVDEAHNYRNPAAPKRAGVLREFMRSKKKREIVLLTATPVNNSIDDLHTLLQYFLQDGDLAHKAIPSLKQIFKQVKKEEPQNLNPKPLNRLIDKVTVKRNRQFIQKHYGDDIVLNPLTQKKEHITFPKPKPITVKYNLDHVLPGLFTDIKNILKADSGKPLLTMARYQVDNYAHQTEKKIREGALIGLLRSALLKRFESSAHAFSRTCHNMVDSHKRFLNGMDEGYVLKKKPKDDGKDLDEEEFDNADEKRLPLTDFAAEDLRRDVENDVRLLSKLAEKAKGLKREQDPKLQTIVREIEKIAQQALRDSTNPRQQRDNRKVLIFSYYKDTAKWIYDFLCNAVDNNPKLRDYKGNNEQERVLMTSGSPDGGELDSARASQRFAPHTATPTPPKGDIEDECDILITTDVLAEGTNLQQCRHIINYDLPWNPMRLIQRHGRIDRLLSKHPTVFLRTFFPAQQLDELLNLEELVHNKLILAAATTGVPEPPIEGGARGRQYFSEERAEIERLMKEDPSSYIQGRTQLESQIAEEYRQTLHKALRNEELKKKIKELPGKASGGMRGKKNGYFFCVKVGNYPEPFLRFVIQGGSKHNATLSETLDCLSLIECSENTKQELSESAREKVYPAWDWAQKSILREWNSNARLKAFYPQVSKLNRDISDFLRRHLPPNQTQAQTKRILEILKSSWPRRDETGLRTVWREKDKKPQAAAQALCEFIESTRIRPYKAMPVYRKIDKSDLHLVCWLAVFAPPKS